METTATPAAVVQTTDDKVRALFDSVQVKKEAIAFLEKPNWQAAEEFRFSADSLHNKINIRTVTTLNKLVEMLAFLKERASSFKEAAEELGVKASKFTWLGFTIDEWSADFKTRVDQIHIKDKRAELSLLESKLSAIMSPELKAKLELEAITAAFDSLS